MTSPAPEDGLYFGECPCGNAIERPFWDSECFDCQDERRRQDEERLDELGEEDRMLYGI